MTVEHSTLTGASLHEPKGTASAGADTFLQANGAGASSWVTVNNANKIYINHTVRNISAASSSWIVVPLAGSVTKIWSVLHDAITVANAGITFEIGGVAMTDSALTITFSGSAPGDVDSSTPSAANTLTAGQALEIITDGASSTTAAITLTIEVDVT